MDSTAFVWHNHLADFLHVRIFNGAATLMGNGGPNAFPFDNITLDPNGTITGSAPNFIYTAPLTGYYLVTFNYGVAWPAVQGETFVEMLINGSDATTAYLGRFTNFNTADQIQINCGKTFKFNTGDTLQFRLYFAAGSNQNSASGNGESWAEITFMAPA